jgi:hypothetical protein
MFIEDQSRKVIFDMRFYKLVLNNNDILIFDHRNKKIGIMGSYDNEKMSQEVMQHIQTIIQTSQTYQLNGYFTLPSKKEMQKVMESNEKI